VLTAHKGERAILDLPSTGQAVIEVRSANEIVLSNLVITGKADVGILLEESENISIQRLDLATFSQGLLMIDSAPITIAGCQMMASDANSTIIDSIAPPSRASNNILVSTGLADISGDEPVLLLAQKTDSQDQISAIKHHASPLKDGLVAHFAFGPDNWRTDRIAGQNIVSRGEPGSQQPGHIGNSVRLKRNSIQLTPINWNGSDLPRAVNFWYWNTDNSPRDTFFIVTGSEGSKPGFTLRFQQETLFLDFGSSRLIWSAPDFIGKPTMMTLVVPHRTARLSELQFFIYGVQSYASLEGDDPVFDSSSASPHLASKPDRMNMFGQKHHFDELSFWNRALSAREVEVLYNAGDGVSLFDAPRQARGGIYYPRDWDWPWQIDSKKHRDDLVAIWKSLKGLDIGNGVPTLEARRFAGEPRTRIHVDPSQGNDFFGSGSPSRPFKSLHRALEALPLDGAKQLKRSTVIDLAPGIYELDQRLSIESWGSTTNWLAIRGPSGKGPRPIITYSNRAVDRALKDRDAGGKGAMKELFKVQGQYIEISGLIMDQRRDELPGADQIHEGAIRFFAHIGQNASNGVGCRVLDTEIRNFLHAGIKGNAKGLIIDGVYIHDGGNTFHDHCIYISSEGEGSSFEVRRSLLINVTGAATNQHKSSDGNDLPPPQGAKITHNVILGCEHFGITTSGIDGEIAHNAISYSKWYGVHFYRSSASLTRVQNNIFVGYPDPDLPKVMWTSYNLAVAKTKEPAGVVVEGNYFEKGPTTDRQARPRNPGPWEAGKTYYTSNTVERNGAYYICEVLNNSKEVSQTGPEGTDPNRPNLDGSNIRWWFLTRDSNRVEGNLLDGDDSDGRNFVDTRTGNFRLRDDGQAVGIGVDIGYTNGRNPGPWPVPVP